MRVGAHLLSYVVAASYTTKRLMKILQSTSYLLTHDSITVMKAMYILQRAPRELQAPRLLLDAVLTNLDEDELKIALRRTTASHPLHYTLLCST